MFESEIDGVLNGTPKGSHVVIRLIRLLGFKSSVVISDEEMPLLTAVRPP